jgi:hypothetical protein
MQRKQSCLPRLIALVFASALVVVGTSANAETVVASIQAAGSQALEASTVASVLDNQLLPTLDSSTDMALSTLGGLCVAVLHTDVDTDVDTDGHTDGHTGGCTSGQILDLNDEIHSFAKGSSCAIFERVVSGSASAVTEPWADDAALVPVAAVPEPGTYALMFGSMAMVGSTARRRRNDALGWMASRRREDVAA